MPKKKYSGFKGSLALKTPNLPLVFFIMAGCLMTKSHHQEKPRSAQTPNGHAFLPMTKRFRPVGLLVGLWPEAYNLASPQTSFGVVCHALISPPRTSAKHRRHLRSPITGRLRFFVKRNPSRFLRFARSMRLLIECARNL